MQTEESLEEIIVTGKTWFGSFITENWLILALASIALTICVFAWRRGLGNSTGLLQKSLLAGASGILCYVVFYFGFDEWPLPLFFAVSGTLFAAGVLFPYVGHGRFALIRYIGLIVISAASYWSAIEIVRTGIFPNSSNGWRDYLLASLAGALIVLFGARLIIPLRSSLPLAIAGLLAATVGGFVFVIPYNDYLAIAVWHVLMAIAVHIATSWSRNLRRS